MVRGPISMDTYQRSYIITARAIMLIDKISKKDEAPEKRVELHLHTNMSAMDGMSAAEEIRKKDSDVVIIFITNMPQYAIRGYAVEALDYVLKPVSYFAFSQRLSKLW